MTYNITFVYDKGIGVLNEDELLLNDPVFGVFDGATGLVPFKNKQGNSGGKIAAEIARDAFESTDGPLICRAKKANDLIRLAMEKEGIDQRKKEGVWTATAAAIRLYGDKVEYVGIADSLVLALYRNENVELLTPYHDFDAESIKLLTDLRKNGVVDIQERIRDQFSKVRYSANVSYGALNGDANAAKFLSSGFVPREGLESILLFSDGFFLPKCDPGADEDWNGFAALYRTGGLNGILEQVRNMERSDPECVLYPRSKLHDDASAIAIDFKK